MKHTFRHKNSQIKPNNGKQNDVQATELNNNINRTNKNKREITRSWISAMPRRVRTSLSPCSAMCDSPWVVSLAHLCFSLQRLPSRIQCFRALFVAYSWVCAGCASNATPRHTEVGIVVWSNAECGFSSWHWIAKAKWKMRSDCFCLRLGPVCVRACNDSVVFIFDADNWHPNSCRWHLCRTIWFSASFTSRHFLPLHSHLLNGGRWWF